MYLTPKNWENKNIALHYNVFAVSAYKDYTTMAKFTIQLTSAIISNHEAIVSNNTTLTLLRCSKVAHITLHGFSI